MNEIPFLFNKANRFLKSAKLLYKDGDYDSSVSRCYYAMYYCIEALLLKKNIIAKSHKGVLIKFHIEFIKNNYIPKKYGQQLSRMQQKRELGDYSSSFSHHKNDTNIILMETKEFIEFMIEFESK